VILYIPGDDVVDLAEDITSQSPSFIAIRGNQYWVAITRQGERDIDGYNTYTFYTSSSSAGLGTNEVILTFSFATSDALFAQQVVIYDWLTALEELGGAIALACVSHFLIMSLWNRLKRLYRRYWLGEIILEGENEEVKEVVIAKDHLEVSTEKSINMPYDEDSDDDSVLEHPVPVHKGNNGL